MEYTSGFRFRWPFRRKPERYLGYRYLNFYEVSSTYISDCPRKKVEITFFFFPLKTTPSFRPLKNSVSLSIDNFLVKNRNSLKATNHSASHLAAVPFIHLLSFLTVHISVHHRHTTTHPLFFLFDPINTIFHRCLSLFFFFWYKLRLYGTSLMRTLLKVEIYHWGDSCVQQVSVGDSPFSLRNKLFWCAGSPLSALYFW